MNTALTGVIFPSCFWACMLCSCSPSVLMSSLGYMTPALHAQRMTTLSLHICTAGSSHQVKMCLPCKWHWLHASHLSDLQNTFCTLHALLPSCIHSWTPDSKWCRLMLAPINQQRTDRCCCILSDPEGQGSSPHPPPPPVTVFRLCIGWRQWEAWVRDLLWNHA